MSVVVVVVVAVAAAGEPRWGAGVRVG